MDKKPRVLVVDDEVSIRQLTIKILEKEDFEVFEAVSGDDALIMLENNELQFDVILLDIMMPGINGFEVLHRIRRNQATETLKVIMLTAMANIEDKVSAFSAGANDYMVKPIENDELVARVKMQVEFRCTELSLLESQRQFQQIGEISPFPILILSHDGQTEYINPQFTKLFGYTIDDIPTIRTWFELAFPDTEYRKEVMSIWKNDEDNICNDETELLKRELDVFCSDKSTKTVTIRTLQMDGDKFYRVFHDITDSKQAQAELNHKTHDLTGRVKELDCMYSIGKLIETPDTSVAQILQGTVELLPIAWRYPEVTCAQITLDDQEFASEGFKETPWQQTCNIVVHEEPVGIIKVGYLEERPTCDEGPFVNEERNLLNAISERLGRVIERKNAKKALQESEERFKEMANLLPQSVFELDLTGRLTFVNNHGIVSTGYTLEDFNAGINAIEIFIPEDRERIVVNMSKRLEGIEFPDHEYTVLRKDGRTFPVLLYSSPIIREGSPAGLRGIALDITERKQAEEELRQSEHTYHAIVDNMVEVFYRTDIDGQLLMVSPSGPGCLGYSSIDEMVGLDLARDVYFNPEDRESFMKAILPTGSVRNFELILKKKSGEPAYGETSSRIYHDDDGNIAGIEGVIRDVTERKHAEEVLKESKERIAVILNSVQAGVTIVDAKTHMIDYVNPAAASMIGTGEANICGKICHEFICPRKAGSCPITDLGMKVDNSENIMLTASGEKLDILKTVTPIKLLDGDYLIETFVDITERKRIEGEIAQKNEELRAAEKELREINQYLEHKVEERTTELKQVNDLLRQEITDRVQAHNQLQQQEQHFRSLIENSTDVILITNADGTVAYTSPSYKLILGYENHETNHIFDYIHPDYMETAIAKFAQLFETSDEAVHTEVCVQHKNGNWRFVEAVGSNLLDNPAVSGIVVNFHDVTERKQAEDEVHEKNRILQEAMEQLKSSQEQLLQSAKLAAVGELISGISHELKNPLAAISMAAEILDSNIDDEKSKKHVQIVSNHVQRAVSIVDNLLSFARKYEPNRNYVSINDAIQSTIELLSYELMRDKIEVVAELDTDIPHTMADFNQLQHVFLNILGNAEQAMHEAHGQGNLVIRTQEYQETIQITIADDGPGIPEIIKERIFEPFFTTKKVGKGTGLGLSICYGIIEQHNGTIHVESKEGEGSTFTIELPVLQQAVVCAT